MTAAALLLSACAVASDEPPLAHHPHDPEPEVRGVRPEDQDPPREERPPVTYVNERPRCAEGQIFAVNFIGYDAALGSRYHWARVRNCTAEAQLLPDPVLHGRDLGNIWGELSSEPREDQSVTLQPDESIELQLHWLSNGTCERGIQDLRVQLGDQTFDSPENCLQLWGNFAPEREEDITWNWGTTT